jgi:hypothetical protein
MQHKSLVPPVPLSLSLSEGLKVTGTFDEEFNSRPQNPPDISLNKITFAVRESN